MDNNQTIDENTFYIDEGDKGSIVIEPSYVDDKHFSELTEQINAIDYKNSITINSVSTSINCRIIKQNKKINKLCKDIKNINETVSINYNRCRSDQDSTDSRMGSLEDDLLKLKNEYDDFKHSVKAFNFYFVCITIIIVFIMIVGGYM